MVARIILDVVISCIFITFNDMIRSHDVLAINEESCAAIHIVVSKGHSDERKNEYDNVFHAASVGCILCIIIVGSSANVKLARKKIRKCKKRKALCRSASRL